MAADGGQGMGVIGKISAVLHKSGTKSRIWSELQHQLGIGHEGRGNVLQRVVEEG